MHHAAITETLADDKKNDESIDALEQPSYAICYHRSAMNIELCEQIFSVENVQLDIE
jgi:hypothetical protein